MQHLVNSVRRRGPQENILNLQTDVTGMFYQEVYFYFRCHLVKTGLFHLWIILLGTGSVDTFSGPNQAESLDCSYSVR